MNLLESKEGFNYLENHAPLLTETQPSAQVSQRLFYSTDMHQVSLVHSIPTSIQDASIAVYDEDESKLVLDHQSD